MNTRCQTGCAIAQNNELGETEQQDNMSSIPVWTPSESTMDITYKLDLLYMFKPMIANDLCNKSDSSDNIIINNIPTKDESEHETLKNDATMDIRGG